MRQIAEFVAVLACGLFIGAALYTPQRHSFLTFGLDATSTSVRSQRERCPSIRPLSEKDFCFPIDQAKAAYRPEETSAPWPRPEPGEVLPRAKPQDRTRQPRITTNPEPPDSR